jgi:hypothetical protein
MNFHDLMSKIRAIDESPAVVQPQIEPDDGLDEVAPAAIGAMAAQAMAKKLKSNPATPASPDNPWNDAEPTKECGDMAKEPSKEPGNGELLTGECGGMMSGPMSAPKQSDSVTMNVSMNGSGSGGIKDLLDILRNIEKSGGQDSDDVLVGIGAEENFSDATTRPNPTNVPVPDSGEDLHREKDEYKAVNGGGNPMRVRESLVAKLSAKYSEIKGE